VLVEIRRQGGRWRLRFFSLYRGQARPAVTLWLGSWSELRRELERVVFGP